MPVPRPTIYDRTGQKVYCVACIGHGLVMIGVELAARYCHNCGRPYCFRHLRIQKHACV